jgi:hypothetical protein
MPETTHSEYRVKAFWMGWMGGYGDERKIESRLNEMSREGWRLTSAKACVCFWMWVIPRYKMLAVFERSA